MEPKSISATGKRVLVFAFVLGLVPFSTSKAQAQTFNVIYNFTGGSDGGWPLAGLMMSAKGILYGTTSIGGNFAGGPLGAGVVFEMTENGKEKVVYTFTGGADGANPYSSLIMDAAGNLYGTTYAGGAYGAGTVFVVTESGKEKVLYSFTGGTDGANPEASLAMDASGNLYGTTFAGGAYGGGTVFEIPKGSSKEKVLYSFGEGTDGANPVAGVTLGTKGKLYGTTSAGGTDGYGIVFQLTGSSSGWKETVLHTFEMQSDGGNPYAGLVFDQSGNLYGAATSGGDGAGGTVFELTPSGSAWDFSVIYGLPGWSLSGPYRNLLVDASGTIYGTTHCDGTWSNGTVFELTPSGGTWTYTLLFDFPGSSVDGYYLHTNLVQDTKGNLYGTAMVGGADNFGVVFKVTP